jgi:antitoxin component of RelBE/YafQ-DinJ toxin-antitoxin module
VEGVLVLVFKKASILVRVSPRLKQQAEKRAKELEMSLSEYIRVLIQREITESKDK